MTDPQTTPAAKSPQTLSPPRPWPIGATIHRIVFVADRPTDHPLIGELPAPLNRRAVALPSITKERAEFELLSIPIAEPEDAESVLLAREWASAGSEPAQTITFQSAHLLWGVGRAAIVAAPARLPPLEAVLSELGCYELELREVETQLGTFWADLEADAGHAFHPDRLSARHRNRMAQRFCQLLVLRARLTRIIPFLLTPHVYPPTLASQVSERLRERSRMRHRVEMLQEQFEVFERIYDACGQRTSDDTAARKGQLLEMVIIVLLSAQILLTLFEILTHVRR